MSGDFTAAWMREIAASALEARALEGEWRASWASSPWAMPFGRLESLWREELLRLDPNAWDGEWKARLPHLVAEVDLHGRTVMVPMYEPDPERLAWRRRKWWGRGPIKPLRVSPGCEEWRFCLRLPWCEYPECLPFWPTRYPCR